MIGHCIGKTKTRGEDKETLKRYEAKRGVDRFSSHGYLYVLG